MTTSRDLPSLIETERAMVKRFGLHQFIKLAWHVLEPATPFQDNWHVQAVCEHAQALYDGDIRESAYQYPPEVFKKFDVCRLLSCLGMDQEASHQDAVRFLFGRSFDGR